MAPSTATPSNLHRTPTACLQCRAAKVRCLLSQQSESCNRCVANTFECVFVTSRRARTRQPRRLNTARTTVHQFDSAQPAASPSQRPSSYINRQTSSHEHNKGQIVTADVRTRIIAALASLKGRRGAPFTFVTSGDVPVFGLHNDPRGGSRDAHYRQPSAQPETASRSLKLSSLLCPLPGSRQASAVDNDPKSTSPVRMPSYLSSMTLGQTITDPIESGILARSVSLALFDHFMLDMNAKWEYVLDPHFDTHDDVRRRSSLLFVTILYCSCKFVTFNEEGLVSTVDVFLQSRLCSVARNLAVRTFAEGDRSIEAMQAFYLLACWKEPDDDVSYLHSGYAVRVLHDLDLEREGVDDRQVAQRWRTWLALFRQDKQQSLFFLRRTSFGLGDDDSIVTIGDLDTWLKMPYALPSDFVACCSADVRRLQTKMRATVQKASSTMLPFLVDLMDSELNRWRMTWQNHLEGQGRTNSTDSVSLDQRLLRPGRSHLDTLVGLWEHSVRFNIASTIFRKALMAAVAPSHGAIEAVQNSSISLDLPSIADLLSTNVPGLSSSIEGAFGTIRQLLSIPAHDLRRSPDALLLLGPHTALFLCLLLCLPCNGILGPSFQHTAIGLIQDLSRHVAQSVRSPQDSVALHATYLDSLTQLLEPGVQLQSSVTRDSMRHTNFNFIRSDIVSDSVELDESELQAAYVLAGGDVGLDSTIDSQDSMLNMLGGSEHTLQMQSLVNILDPGYFWEMPSLAEDADARIEMS